MRPASAGDGVGAEARYLSSGPTLCASDDCPSRATSDDERAERRRCDVRCDVRIARGGASKQERPLWRRVRRRSTKNCNQTGVQSPANKLNTLVAPKPCRSPACRRLLRRGNADSTPRDHDRAWANNSPSCAGARRRRAPPPGQRATSGPLARLAPPMHRGQQDLGDGGALRGVLEAVQLPASMRVQAWAMLRSRILG